MLGFGNRVRRADGAPPGNQERQNARTSRGLLAAEWDTILFLLFLVAYMWVLVDPRLVHHAFAVMYYYHSVSYVLGSDFLLQHLERPGGAAEYLFRFFSQWYAFRWAGAVIFAITAMLTCYATDFLIRCSGGTRHRLLRYVPAMILVVLYGSYSHPLSALLSLLIGLAGFMAYTLWTPNGLWQRLAVLSMGYVLLYHLAGSGSMVFPVMVAVYEVLIRRRPAIAATAAACAAVVPWAESRIFLLHLRDAYLGFLFAETGVLPDKRPWLLALYVWFPLVLAALAVGHATFKTRNRAGGEHRSRTSRKRRDKILGYALAVRVGPALRAGVALSFFATVAWLSVDRITRTTLELDYHCQERQWETALAVAGTLPVEYFNARCYRNVMMALYHTGHLGDEMFRFPQSPSLGLFILEPEARDLGTFLQESRLFLELGQVNLAERCVCEYLESSGESPEALQQLALIQIVKGQPETARVFLNSLARYPFHRDAARDMLGRLQDDPLLEGDRQVAAIRRNMLASDCVASDTTVEKFLETLLEANPDNRMAFEFLMAHYLAARRPEEVARRLPRLKDFHFSHVPRHYQEATAVWAMLGGRWIAPQGYGLDPRILDQAAEFERIVATANVPADAALACGLGGSYFFYLASNARHE